VEEDKLLNCTDVAKSFCQMPPVIVYSTMLASARVSNGEEVHFGGGITYEAE
jgi:hypothetical protein